MLESTHNVTIAWRKPGGTTTGGFDPTTLSKTTAKHPPYATGAARVQVLPALDQERLVAEDQVRLIGYQVTVDVTDTDYAINDVGTVTALLDDNADPTLADTLLTIRGVERGSHAFERVLTCVEYLG